MTEQNNIWILEKEERDGEIWASLSSLKNSDSIDYVEFSSLEEAAKYLLETTSPNNPHATLKADDLQTGFALGVLLQAGIDPGMHLINGQWLFAWQSVS